MKCDPRFEIQMNELENAKKNKINAKTNLQCQFLTYFRRQTSKILKSNVRVFY